VLVLDLGSGIHPLCIDVGMSRHHVLFISVFITKCKGLLYHKVMGNVNMEYRHTFLISHAVMKQLGQKARWFPSGV
jgi:hypothetical protein